MGINFNCEGKMKQHLYIWYIFFKCMHFINSPMYLLGFFQKCHALKNLKICTGIIVEFFFFEMWCDKSKSAKCVFWEYISTVRVKRTQHLCISLNNSQNLCGFISIFSLNYQTFICISQRKSSFICISWIYPSKYGQTQSRCRMCALAAFPRHLFFFFCS